VSRNRTAGQDDASANRIKNTDRNGKVIEHYFDRLGRETDELWKDSLGATIRAISYGYTPPAR
jgi:hypothetical protein